MATDKIPEMVERVAQILEPQAWAALGVGDTLAYKNRRTSSIRKARAAIAATRTPTAQMCVAAYPVRRDRPEFIEAAGGVSARYLREVWEAMIDSALEK